MTQIPKLAIAPNISAYFQEMLADTIRARQLEATEAAASYLTALLTEFAHPDEGIGNTFAQPLTFQLRDALEAVGAERFRRLRTLGDHVLYALGFFGGHLDNKGVDRGYVVNVGSTAYLNAAAMLKLRARREEPPRDVLSELGQKFDRFAEVLRDVSDATLACGARSERTIVKLYERWLRTGSTRLAEELGAHGIVATRGPGGLN